MNTQYELYHSGKKGQKWGVRLYQNPDGSLTPLGRIRYAKQQKTRRKNLEKARIAKAAKAKAEADAKAAKEKFEADKKRAIESGSATDVLKFRGKLTTQELQAAKNRIDLERTLAEISAKEVKSATKKLSEIMNKVDSVRVSAIKGINAYNLIASVYNSTNKSGSTLPKINLGKGNNNGNNNGNDKDKKKDKK